MKYESNIQQVILDLKGRVNSVKELSQVQREVALHLVASNARRIHTMGLDVNGTLIGHYSTKPIYVSPKNSPLKFAGKGKNGQSTFKSGKAHKSRYFSAGYREFRSSIGREASKVNLQLSGRLFRDWAAQPEGKDWVVGFISDYGSKVAEGNEKHFGKQIYGVTRSDEQSIQLIVDTFVNKKMEGQK